LALRLMWLQRSTPLGHGRNEGRGIPTFAVSVEEGASEGGKTGRRAKDRVLRRI
jgi:hypothetical protein